MYHINFEENNNYNIAILIKENHLNKEALIKNYINQSKLSAENFIAFSLKYNSNNKITAKDAKAYLATLLKALRTLNITTLYVCDSAYFKYLTKVRKVNTSYGYVKPCVIEGFEDFNVILSINYSRLFYDPQLNDYIELSLRTLETHITGTYKEMGSDIIHSVTYPESIKEIKEELNKLYKYPIITCDIETFSLKHYKANIGTIAFSIDQHNGTAFKVALDRSFTNCNIIKRELRNFFKKYQGKVIYHNGSYDIKVLIYWLFMSPESPFIKDITRHHDIHGMLEGISVLTKNIHDTKIIAYLATNSTAGNNLGLKHLALEFAGDYGQDNIDDITKIPTEELLKYNFLDCCATRYVYDKYYPMMVADDQLNIYENIFIPSLRALLQMELSGIPIKMKKVKELELDLNLEIDIAHTNLIQNKIIKNFKKKLRHDEFIIKNKEWKRKSEPLEYFNYIKFNPASNKQLQGLLYNFLKLPIIDKTDTGLPAVGGKTLKKLLNKTKDKNIISVLENLISMAGAEKILNTFIKAFKENTDYCHVLETHLLFGNFNLGGTVSGRLSSSKPNLQNLPSGSEYAKRIKECFKAPDGWIMCGADFDSLEDRISALTTKDPNKLKVYEQGYDGHCLRAHAYFGKNMPDIDSTSVTSINSIEDKYPKERQDSKMPTFLLTYGGTYHGMMDQGNFTKEEAQAIERNYHELYKVSDQWVADKIEEATHKGYVEVAFGLRVRTPILKQTILNTSVTPYEAKKEARTAGNALGQSYGLLNNRAANELQERIIKSPYWHDIRPIIQIHDAMYFIVKNKIGAVKWLNDNLTDCMKWQELPEIQHDQVKLSGAMDLFYPSWADTIGLPVGATKQEILTTCRNAYEEKKKT